MTDPPIPLARRAAGLRPSMIREHVAAAGRRPLLSLAGGLPPPEAFPTVELAAAAARLLAGDPAALQYAPSEGDPELLERIEADLAAEGVPGSVLVTTGSQQALDLVAKVLLDPGDVAVVEHPTYVGALRALAAYEPRFEPIPVDQHGLDTDVLEHRLAGGLRPKLCYVVPNFSNPTGATMTAERRDHLAALSERYSFLVVEDDPYGQLRFTGEHVAPVAGRGGRVVYLGSFSKTVVPGFRVGFAAAPEWLHGPMLLAKQATDLSSSSFGQRLIVELRRDDAWHAAHVGRLRELYRARAEALLGALDDRFTTRAPTGGMFLWASVPVDAGRLTAVAMSRDVAIVPGTEFALTAGHERDVRLSFSTLAPGALAEAAGRLAEALDELSATAPR